MPASPSSLPLALPLSSTQLWFSAGLGQGGGFGPTGGGVNPYAQPPGAMGPPPKKSNLWLWLLGGLGVAGLLGVICCGGLGYWGMQQANTVIAGAIKDEVKAHPAVQEHLGEITSLNTNYTQTGEETQKRGSGVNVIVIDAEGSKGKGKFLAEQSPNPQPGGIFNKIDLRLPSGEEISIK